MGTMPLFRNQNFVPNSREDRLSGKVVDGGGALELEINSKETSPL